MEGRVEWIIFQLRRMLKEVLETETRVTRYEDLEIASTSAITSALEIVTQFAPQVVQKLVLGCHRSLFRYSLGIGQR